MKSSRQRITLLQSKIKEVIPDQGNDLFGFQGVSRDLILESLSESYDLLSSLENYEGKLETVFLERQISELFEKASSRLKDKGFEKRLDEFNELLNILTRIRFLIKQAYITLAKDPIRTETEIKKAKDELVSLTSILKEIKEVSEEILNIKTESESFIDDLSERQSKARENQAKTEVFLAKITDLNAKATEIADNLETWNEEIDETKESIKSQEMTITKMTTEITDQKNKSAENLNKILIELKKVEEVSTKNIDQQAEIQKTIEDANRLGMAGAFKNRKDELRLPLLFWTSVSIATLVGLVGLSYSLVQDILTNSVELNQLFIKIPIFASSVWLGWFSARQFGYTSRIREDYSYKYAVSMAFEGYKNATREIDEEMLKQLLQLTIYNISKNPIEIYDSKSNHGTPYSEFIDSLFNRAMRKGDK
jgi:predicted  nucleic acid-binding Zn-ribbon protein